MFRVPRRTLFLKICLWFWVTTAVVAASMVALDRLTGFFPMGEGHRRDLGIALRMFGGLAAERRAAGDLRGVERLSAGLHKETGISVWLFDSSGKASGYLPVPREAADLAGRVRREGRPLVEVHGVRTIAAHPLAASDGSRYVVAGEAVRPPHPPPPGMAGPPGLPPGVPPGWHKMWPIRTLVFFLVSGAICALLARYISSPLVQLREAARRLGAGDLSARIGTRIGKRGDELSDLAADFDRMAERITSLITMQRQLLGDVSHELRSPLARLNVALELARRETGGRADKSLDRIGAEADALNGMITQVLMLTRLESGIEPVPGAPVELAHLVREIAENADFEAKGSGRRVSLTEWTEVSTVSGNAELLARAIENVVRNAIRYTPEKGRVEIRLRNTTVGGEACAEVSVRDHGEGVPESELQNLFRPFYRVSNARERESGGTGLGLAITARAVLLHGGTVLATNVSGGGLQVEITLPLRGSHSHPPPSAL
jgi:signal transduction histidine kinase